MKPYKFQARRIIAAMLTFTIVAICFSQSMKPVHAADEFDSLRAKWGQKLTGGTYSTTDSDIYYYLANLAQSVTNKNKTGLLDSMNKSSSRTYLWSDLNRPTTNPQYSNDLYNAYSRIKTMALALKSPGSSLYNNATLKSEIIGALDWMYAKRYNENEKEYAGTNWWEYEIGVPLFLLDTMVLMYNDLSSDQIAKYIRAIDRFCPTATMKSDGQWVETGANRVDKSLILTLRGILGKNATKLAQARDALGIVLAYVKKGDGFYQDGSFIQHDNVPSTGSYGYVLLDHLTDLLYLTNGSAWAVQDANVNNVQNWVTQSFEPLIYKGAMMDSVRGRSISREDLRDYKTGRELSIILLRFAQISPPEMAMDIRSMVKSWVLSENRYENYFWGLTINGMQLVKSVLNNASITPRADMVRNVQYPSMDRVVHLRSNFAFGVSMYSSRMTNYEMMNNENLKGWYTNEGMTYIYNNDLSQYSDNYWPTVNALRLPGVTSDGAPRKDGYESSKSWVGGVALDDLYGTAGMDLDPDNSTLEGKKSWFMFDDEIVALGAGITSRDSRKVETIVENRKINSAGSNKLTVNNTAKNSSIGWSETMNGVQWAQLQGTVANSDIGYYFPDKANLDGLREQRYGSWSQINATGSTAQLKGNFLSLSISHGVNPLNAAYSYVLLPNKTAAQTSAYSADPDIQIVVNNSNVQAVRENKLGLLGANFWSPGTAGYLTARTPASVMAQATGDTLDVSVSDPTQRNGTVVLEIGKEATQVISKDVSVNVLQTSPSVIISVDTSGSMGAAHNIKLKFDTTQKTTVELSPVADSFVRNGTFAGQNYGSSNLLAIANGTSDYARQALLKFDLSAVEGRIDSVNLLVYGATTDSKGSDSTIAGYLVNDDKWTEAGVNWNNKPALDGLLQEVRFQGAHQWRTYNVTEFVKTQAGGDKTASFALAQTGQGLFAEINSRENTVNKPKLHIVYVKTDPGGNGTGGGGTIRPITLVSDADAYVRDGAYAKTNFGSDKTLVSKKTSQTDYNRKFAVRFNAANVLQPIQSATLKLYPSYAEKPNTVIKIFGSSNGSWQEAGLNWSTWPNLTQTQLGTQTVAKTGAYLLVDVTAFMKSQLAAGNKVFSFGVENATEEAGVLFDSKENMNPPQLYIQ